MTSSTTAPESPARAGKVPKAGKSRPVGGRTGVSSGMLLTMRQIAVLGKIDRGALSEYLQKPSAPKPDKMGRRHFGEVMRFVGVNQRRSGNAETMREVLLSMEVESKQLELQTLKGDLVNKKDIAPQIEAACASFVSALERIHVGEVAPKLVGKNAIEIREMLAAANDRVVRDLNEGLDSLTE